MASQQEKRQRVADLLCAEVDPRRISDTVGVSLKTVYNIRKSINNGIDVQRKPGSGGANKKRNPDFLKALKAKVAKDPTISMRKMASELDVEWPCMMIWA